MDRLPAPPGRMQWLALSPLLVAIALLAALTVASAQLLSAVRAYVGGESLWSKARKDASTQLERYLASHDVADYERFRAALTVPLGDRRGRQALDREPPDREEARRAFVIGGNHPEDASGMVELYLRFRRVSFMSDAIAIWAEADGQIEQLVALGQRVHEQVLAGEADTGQLRPLVAELQALDRRLNDLERSFSATLGEASRAVHRLVLATAVVLAAGLLLGAVCATRVVLRRQASVEQDLRESNERWSLAADAAGLGLFDWNLHTHRARVDARGAALYGLPAEPMEAEAGELTRSRIHPDDLGRFRGAMAGAVANPASASIRYRVRMDDGTERHLEAIARVRPGQSGVGTRMVGTLRDVTAEVHAARLRLEKEAAERASRAKSEFLSRVSHELRTPLNAVLGFSELLLGEPDEPLTARQALRVQHVIDAGRHLLALIDDILRLSDLDGVGGPSALGAVAVQPLIDAALAGQADEAEARGLRLHAEATPLPLWVRSEPRRLAEVLRQLVSNAVRYNRPGGMVRMCSRRQGEEVCVEVQDTGPGLAPEQVAQLFQPFNRLGAEYTRVPGSGLGLVIAHRLVQQLGGRIEVHSTPGAGTCVQVALPAHAGEADAAAGGDQAAAGR